MSFSIRITALAVSLLFSVPCKASAAPCNTFRLWAGAPQPKADPGKRSPASVSIFNTEYKTWLVANPGAASDPAHQAWLDCVRPWVEMDSDGDGQPDWRAFIDRRLSRVLIPADDDIDGDGTPNILDPQPFRADAKGVVSPDRSVPTHLRLGGKRSQHQEALLREFGLLALDHTDQHRDEVLVEILAFLREVVPKGLTGTKTSVRILYAFESHDLQHEIAAFHREIRAISIAGKSSFPKKFGPRERFRVLSAFAHELGHAFIFDWLGAAGLARVADQFGGWQTGATKDDDLFSAPFLKRHPLRTKALSIPTEAPSESLPANLLPLPFTGEEKWKRINLVSQYASENVHEWFSEVFAAHLLNRLAALRPTANLREQFTLLHDRPNTFWVNYNNLDSQLDAHLRETLNALQ